MHKKLLQTSAILLFAGIFLTAMSYLYIDKPIAEYFFPLHTANTSKDWLKFLIKLSTIIEYLPPFIVLFFLIKNNTYKILSKTEKIFLVITLNMTLTTSIKDILKFTFGRYWPTSWIGNNPSWIKTHDYGFHFFHGGVSYNSFPSGHTAAIFAVMSIVWMVYPRWRWLCVLSCATVMLSLIILDYHFVSDVIAGMILGTITGINMGYYFFRQNKVKN